MAANPDHSVRSLVPAPSTKVRITGFGANFGLALYDEGRTIVRRELGDRAFILFHLAEDGSLVAASGLGPGAAVAKDIRLAEMLIAWGARPHSSDLAAPDVKLKKLLAA